MHHNKIHNFIYDIGDTVVFSTRVGFYDGLPKAYDSVVVRAFIVDRVGMDNKRNAYKTSAHRHWLKESNFVKICRKVLVEKTKKYYYPNQNNI